MDAPCHRRCSTLKNPHWSMTISAEHRSNFTALHWQWWHLHMSEKFSSGKKNPNKQTNKKNMKCMKKFSLGLKSFCYFPVDRFIDSGQSRNRRHWRNDGHRAGLCHQSLCIYLCHQQWKCWGCGTRQGKSCPRPRWIVWRSMITVYCHFCLEWPITI